MEFNQYDKQGLKHGTWIDTVCSFNYHHGVRHGEIQINYTNGNIELTGQYHMGKQIGLFAKYDNKGKIQTYTFFII